MNVRTICLAILYDGDSTGYEIRKLSTEGEYCYFVDASFGAIYPALAKLEDDKLVTSRVEQQDGKPAKKIYSITAPGRHEFINSLFEQLGEDEYRSEFLLFARFAVRTAALAGAGAAEGATRFTRQRHRRDGPARVQPHATGRPLDYRLRPILHGLRA